MADVRLRAEAILSNAAFYDIEAAAELVTAVLDRSGITEPWTEISSMRHAIKWARPLHLPGRTVMILVRALVSNSFNVREDAVFMLENCDIGSCDNKGEIVREVSKLLAHRDCLVRENATEVLGKMSGTN